MSEYFKLPPYNDDQPLVEHPFYQWLTDNVDRSQGGHSKMLDWIKGLGFRVGEDALAPEDVDTLHLVEEHWWRCSPWFGSQAGKDLFKLPTPNEESFYFGGPYFSEFRGITQKLRDMVMAAGWIYNVHPSTTYFEVIGGRLCAKYQQILGSRYICDISDYKEKCGG